jgi:enoyl-CoA hydratase/carnithine racemase
VESEIVRVEKRDHVLTIQIDREEKRNAISPDEFRAIGRACIEAERDDDVRVVVLRGNDEGFCAGGDQSRMDVSAQGGQTPPMRVSENGYLPLLELSKPLIGAITGIAAGAAVWAWRSAVTCGSHRSGRALRPPLPGSAFPPTTPWAGCCRGSSASPRPSS